MAERVSGMLECGFSWRGMDSVIGFPPLSDNEFAHHSHTLKEDWLDKTKHLSSSKN